jgi:hypothetical protein
LGKGSCRRGRRRIEKLVRACLVMVVSRWGGAKDRSERRGTCGARVERGR